MKIERRPELEIVKIKVKTETQNYLRKRTDS